MSLNSSDTPEEINPAPPEKNENPWLNIFLNVIIPAVILTKLSSPEYLGQVYSLVIALSFPLGYGLYDYIQRRKFNFFSGLGLVSVLLTGGIGLFQLNKSWMVAKETSIPLLMGLAVLISQKTKLPLVQAFLNQILDLPKIREAFVEKNQAQRFDKCLGLSSLMLASSFFLSALLNYILAVKILQGDAGSVEFNESLGRMTAWSFPVISLPMMIMVGGVMIYLFKTIKDVTEKEFEDFIRHPR